MTTRYPGGLIRKTPPTITPPVDGEGGSAPGVWTLEQASYYTKQGTWPKPLLPREMFIVGSNGNGQLGQNDRVVRSSPVQVGALTNWLSISSGNSHSISIQNNGTLWSWGNNTNGQLGQNNTTRRSSPVQVGALTNWSYVGTTASSSLAIKTDGTLWSWGSALSGELGQDDIVVKSSPVQVGADTNWSKVSGSFDAAIVLAIKTDGTMWSWGAGTNGGSGQNDLVGRSSPTQIGSLATWSYISVGKNFCAATKTDGTLWLWGNNVYGQLGQSDIVYRSSPVQVGALTNWNITACGNRHVLAVKTDGTLWAWGRNGFNGNLGQNDTISRSSPVQVGSLTTWLKVACCNYSSFAIKTDKTLWSWGNNSSGQLGLNIAYSSPQSSPTQVGALTTWLNVSGGYQFASALKQP